MPFTTFLSRTSTTRWYLFTPHIRIGVEDTDMETYLGRKNKKTRTPSISKVGASLLKERALHIKTNVLLLSYLFNFFLLHHHFVATDSQSTLVKIKTEKKSTDPKFYGFERETQTAKSKTRSEAGLCRHLFMTRTALHSGQK